MSETKIIAAYEAVTETGWAVVDNRGCTRPATAEEASRFYQVPSFELLARQRGLLPRSKNGSA